MEKTRAVLYACCLGLTAAFVAVQIVFVRTDWLYLAVCGALILIGLLDLIDRRPPKLFFLILLCLVYFKLPMVWRGTASKSWARYFFDCFYVPVGCVAYWIARLVRLLRKQAAE